MRILFVGNSITQAGFDTMSGWYRVCGMAATCAETDYVHLTMDGVREFFPESTFEVLDASEYEKNLGAFDITEYEPARDFEADIIIVQMIEKSENNPITTQNFARHYERLINYLNKRGAIILCLGCFWENSDGEAIIRYACNRNGYIYVEIGDLNTPEYKAGDQHKNEFVADHPSDAGMEAIAERIIDKIKHRFF